MILLWALLLFTTDGRVVMNALNALEPHTPHKNKLKHVYFMFMIVGIRCSMMYICFVHKCLCMRVNLKVHDNASCSLLCDSGYSRIIASCFPRLCHYKRSVQLFLHIIQQRWASNEQLILWLILWFLKSLKLCVGVKKKDCIWDGLSLTVLWEAVKGLI